MINGSVIHAILTSPDKMHTTSLMTVKDALEFGFSYVENQDHMVRYVVVGPEMLKKIFKEIDESTVDPIGEKMGTLWSADILFSRKISDNRIIFSNFELKTVLVLDLKPNKITSEVQHATI